MDDQKAMLPAADDPEMQRFARLGMWLAAAEAKNPSAAQIGAAAALRAYYVKELDLPALAAAELSVINGRLNLSAQLLRGLANRHGYKVVRSKESNDQTCTAVLLNGTGEVIGDATYTIEDAKRAGLAGKDNYQKNPGRMLWARASTNVIKDYAPEVALGMITTEEVEEIEGEAEEIPFAETDRFEEYEQLAPASLESIAERQELIREAHALGLPRTLWEVEQSDEPPTQQAVDQSIEELREAILEAS